LGIHSSYLKIQAKYKYYDKYFSLNFILFFKINIFLKHYYLFRNNAFKAALHGSAIIQHVPIYMATVFI